MTPEVALEPARTKARAYENPYVGLRPFMQKDSRLFFGRREQTIALLALLRESRLLPVVGSSGSGKSSLVRAGLVPALLGGFLVDDRDQWLVATLKPGDAPLFNLAQALLEASLAEDASSAGPAASAGALAKQIEADPFEAVSREIALRVGERKNLLLIVDQFEEIFAFRGDAEAETLAARRAEADDFVALLLELAEAKELPVYVVLTMRSDFAGDCDLFRGLPEAMNRTRYLVPRLRREQLRQAIEGPALLEGVTLAPRLLDRVLNEMGDRADQLPILQHALLQTWEQWRKQPGVPSSERIAAGVIEQRHYEAAGTLATALSRHADEVLEVIAPRLVELLLKRLTDTDLRGRRVRRATSFGDLCELAQASGFSEQDVERALDAFQANGRYFVSVAEADTRDGRRIDISHESLIRQWPALRDWVDQERAARDQLLGLRRQHERHEHSKRSKPTLLQEADLAVAEHWRAQHHPSPVWAKRYVADGTYEAVVAYIERSKQEQTRSQQSRKRTIIAVGATLLVFAVAAAAFGLYALREGEKAEAARQEALKAEKQAQASRTDAALQLAANLLEEGRQALQAGEPKQAALALAKSYELDPESQQTRMLLPHAVALGAELEVAVLTTTTSDKPIVKRAMFSPDGTRVVTASSDNTARIWAVPTGRLIATLSGHEDVVNDASFSPDGKVVLTASSDHTARIWDAATGKAVATALSGQTVVSFAFHGAAAQVITAGEDGTARVWKLADVSQAGAGNASTSVELKSHAGDLTNAAFSADGTRVVTTSTDNTLRVWNALDGSQLVKLLAPPARFFRAAVLSPDGSMVATSTEATSSTLEEGGPPREQDTSVRIWNAETGALERTLTGHDGTVNAIAFSPDGKLLVTASSDDTARVWDEQGALVSVLAGHEDDVGAAKFSPDGERIVTVSRDDTARVWYARSGHLIAVLPGHTDEVTDASFSDDGRYVVTVSNDGAARVWNLGGSLASAILAGHTDEVNTASFSPDGSRIVTASKDGSARVWDGHSGAGLFALRHGDAVNAASFSSDGKRIVTASADGTAAIWDVETGARLVRVQHDQSVTAASFSPDGTRILTASDDRSAVVWDARTGALLQSLRPGDSPVQAASFSPDQKLVLTRSAGTISVWDALTGKCLAANLGELIDVAAFSPDGKTIATGAYEATTFWDAPAWARRQKTDDGEVTALSFDATGARLAAAKGTWTRILDAHTLDHLVELKKGHRGAIRAALFSPDGAWLVTAGDDMTARVWDAKTGRVLLTFEGHEQRINAASISPDGQRLVTASGDKTARLWSTQMERRSPREITELIYKDRSH